jgi:hypothetical protein
MRPELKHIRPIFLFTLFIFWLVVGYLIADRFIPIIFNKTSAPLLPPSAVTPFPTPSSRIKQGNVLIVFTNDLTSPNPNLISTWALFVALTDHPSLIVKALYPHPSITNPKMSPADVFYLTPQGQLSPEFIATISSTGFKWDNFIVMDFIAFNAIAGWITGTPIDMSLSLSPTQEQAENILDMQKSFLHNICTHLSSPESDRGPKPNWQVLIPAHMLTDLYFKDTAVNWDRITLSDPNPHCEVLIIP